MPALDIPSLLERDAELAELASSIDATPARGGRLIVVEGPAGIGKTRLLGAAAARARSGGMAVFSARGSELEREFGYGVVRQLFERAISDLPEEERADVLAGAAAPAAAVLAPDAAAVGDAGDASFSTLHGLYWVAANLAERRPLLVVVDDLHWCDAQSLRWLAYLLRRVEGLRILIAVGLRPMEPDGLDSTLAHVTHDPLAKVLRPAALSREAAEQLVRSTLSEQADAAFCTACHDESGGNPLLLEQLLGAVAAERMAPTAAAVGRLRRLGANAVARVLALRFAQLPPEASRLAAAVAILGDGADPAPAAGAGGPRRRGGRRRRDRAGTLRDPAARPAARLRPPGRAGRRPRADPAA